MASSPAESRAAARPDPLAFALRELTACWNQAYEALLGGDLPRVQALLEVADDHTAALAATQGDRTTDLPHLRQEADAARGRLEHGMRAGLQGLREELGRVRHGARALHGYRDPGHGLGARVAKRV